MNPISNLPHLMGHDVESSEAADSHLSGDSSSSGDTISADELEGPSTSMVFPVLMFPLPSPAINLTSPIQSTASMPPVHPMPLVHVMPLVHPMRPVPYTSRGIQENNYDYRFEITRRWSFRNWPISFIDPVSLAAAGFYYTGETDVVRCFECQLVVNHWTDGNIPMQIHEMRSPECRFIRNEHCDNVPIGADPDKVLRTEQRNRNISGQKYICESINNVTGQKLHKTSAEAPVEIADENSERSNSENDTNEMILVEKIAALEQENRALKDARSCKVCTERNATITFLPCGHLATCQYCSPAFTKCIICRKTIKATNRTFFP